MPPTRDAEKRVTSALQRAHSRAEWEAESTARALEAATAEHARAIDTHSEALHEVAALAGALAERGAPTLAEVAQAQRAQLEAERARQLEALAASMPGLTLEEPPPVPAPVQAGTTVAVDVLAGRPRHVCAPEACPCETEA